MFADKEFNEAAADAVAQLNSGVGLEPILTQLRMRGADKIDSIKVVKAAMKITMGQAKSLVDRSDAWSDRYELDRAVHESARQAADELRKQSDIDVIFEERQVDPE